MSKIHMMVYCPSCKHFNNYEDEFSECEMGCIVEHRKALKNKYITECEYWESRE